jgi:hypothetical protein
MGRRRGHDHLFIVCLKKEKSKNTSKRHGGKRGVMSGIFNGLPWCMANEAGTNRPSSYGLLLVCAQQQKEKKEERLGLITHISQLVPSDPAAQPINCLVGRLERRKIKRRKNPHWHDSKRQFLD